MRPDTRQRDPERWSKAPPLACADTASVAKYATDYLRLVTLRVTVLVTRWHHSGVRRGIFGLSATSGVSAR
jgi:hypothetical protein